MNNSRLYTLLAFLLARRVLVQGWSMHPTLAPDERVLFDRLAYRFGEPQKGDVVLVAHPRTPKLRVIKRIAALPGDSVRLAAQGCWVNGRLYAEASPQQETAIAERTWELGPEEYFLLGDDPGHSTDSRHFGLVHRKALLGRAWLVYWPVKRMRWVHGEEESQ
ncbi:MAG TPA: signal peptidase I [Dehalococcoidia bacterium]|nr:signal peptidase I [Dehalococcoidia bacterium]